MRTAGVVACCAFALGASGPAAAAGPSLSIERGKKIVAYTRSVSVSGRLSTRAGGAKVLLQADRFPFDRFRTVAGTATDRDGRYRFRRSPTLGTRYRVRLRRNPSVHSGAVTVYVAGALTRVDCNYCPNGPDSPGEHTFKATVEALVPPEEHVRRVFFYWGQVNGDRHAWPAEVRRVKTVEATRIGPRRIRFKVRYRFRVPRNEPYSIQFRFCGRDHFARDGAGLPGGHRCGDARIQYPAYNRYLG